MMQIKTIDEQIKDLVDALNGNTSVNGSNNILIGQGSQSSGTVHINNSGTQVSTAHLGSLQQTLTTILGLSQAEREEMKLLKEEHELKSKSIKIAQFKKLHKDLRQFVLNVFSWHESVEAINNAQEEKDRRLVELEAKDAAYNYGHNQTYSQNLWTATGYDFGYFNTMLLPKGLTKEDLRVAHIEATLEEEVLNE